MTYEEKRVLEKCLKAMVTPLVEHTGVLRIEMKVLYDPLKKQRDGLVLLDLFVSKHDIGRVIGQKGRTARALRTILDGVASRHGIAYELNLPHGTEKK